MTDSRHARPARRTKRAAFTVVELLIVIAILAILAAMALSAFSRGRGLARRAAMQALFRGMETGLRTYRNELGDYPPSFGPSPNCPWTAAATVDDWAGAHWLAHSMLGLGDDDVDGADGPGFRVKFRGAIHGPYIEVDMANTKVVGPAAVLVDDGGSPILYYRLDPLTRTYNSLHNWLPDLPPATPLIAGPFVWKPTAPQPPRIPEDMVPVDINDYVALGTSEMSRPEFLICSPGQDEQWGDDVDDDNKLDGLGDDYTNLE